MPVRLNEILPPEGRAKLRFGVDLGGGLSQFAGPCEQAPRRWGRHIFADAVATGIVPARHGDSSGVRGAARLWPVVPDHA